MVELRNAGVLDYIRFVMSSLILLFCSVVTFYAIIERKTNFWHAVPGWAALILFIVDLILLGIVEGLQIALVELKRQHPESYRVSHPAAYRLGQMASKGDNVERFLMGRQVFVVVLVFFAAKLTTIQLAENEGFLFPAPHWFRSVFLETGILSCMVVVIIAQLMPQILAAKYPVHFLQFLIMKPAYYACVFLEATGLTHACWLLSAFLGFITRMKDDETTVNPNDLKSVETVMKEVEEKLDSESDSGASSLEDPMNESKKEDGPQFSRFSQLVERVNKQVDPDTLRVLRQYLDTHPEKFHQFPSVVGSKVYPCPQALAQQIEESGYPIPRFLTDISDPQHVPPHIVACELVAKNKQLQETINLLEAKLQALG